MSMTGQYYGGMSAVEAPAEARLAFIRRTYLHVAGAMFAFVAISALLYQAGVSEAILRFVAAMPFSWLLILGGFALLGWMAKALAHNAQSMGMQYGGLALYVVAESLIFAPLFFLANTVAPGVLPKAAGLTLAVFAGLSFYVLTTKKDFSFLRTALVIGSWASLAIIVLGVFLGWNLGLWFSVAMIALACGAILYTTSNVQHEYRTDQYVAAAIELFAAVALLLWYVIRLLMELNRR